MKVFFDTTIKRNYFLLGYFSTSVAAQYKKAQEIAQLVNADVESIHVYKILESRSYKYNDVMYSDKKQQEPLLGAFCLENVHQFLTS
jgi:hypothetical protein